MWSDQASRTGVLGCCHAWTYIVLYILAVALWALFRMTMPTYRCLFNNLFGCLIILIWVFWVVTRAYTRTKYNNHGVGGGEVEGGVLFIFTHILVHCFCFPCAEIQEAMDLEDLEKAW